MDIEQHIRKSFQRYARTIEVPAELDASVALVLRQRGQSDRRRPKTLQRVAFGALIGAFAVTATAFAASPNFADRIYGSYTEFKKKVVTVTMQEYQQIGMKFAGAQRELGEDYPAFEKLAKQMVAAKVQYANNHNQIDFSALTPETYSKLKQLYADIQPYFDRLNHDPIARDMLTSEEYDAYIEAQLQRETILAKAGVNPSAGPVQVKNMPAELQPDFEKAEQTIREFEQRIRQSAKTKG
jgi:hypothetical protein